jgi:hypothetical protein
LLLFLNHVLAPGERPATAVSWHNVHQVICKFVSFPCSVLEAAALSSGQHYSFILSVVVLPSIIIHYIYYCCCSSSLFKFRIYIHTGTRARARTHTHSLLNELMLHYFVPHFDMTVVPSDPCTHGCIMAQ